MQLSGCCIICRLTLLISTLSRSFFFAELKAYIRKAWPTYEKDPDQGFHVFLRQCVHTMLVQNSRALKANSDMQVDIIIEKSVSGRHSRKRGVFVA